MPLVRPFAGLRPAAEYVLEVVAPPYDVLTRKEAINRSAGKPNSFLHISRPEIDMDENIDPCADSVYLKGLENFSAMKKKGILKQDKASCYYIYQLNMGNHVQRGLVAVASVDDYNRHRIKKHEHTHPDKEDDRVKQIDTLNAQTGPVFLTYKHNSIIDAVVDKAIRQNPLVDITADDGVEHRLWMLEGEELTDIITQTFDAMDCLYIADGHHRSAAASRVAQMRKEKNSRHTGQENYNYFLSVIFPDNHVQIFEYNRVIRDLNGLGGEEFLQAVAKNFSLVKQDKAFKPATSTEFGMYLKNQWYKLSIKPALIPPDSVGRLNINLLSNNLIDPILGISDPRGDKRIDFVGGVRGLRELERRVDSSKIKVAFSLYATSLAELMAVADADDVLPPKSTWFEPKLADGLVSHLLS